MCMDACVEGTDRLSSSSTPFRVDSQLTEGPFKNQLDRLLLPVVSFVNSSLCLTRKPKPVKQHAACCRALQPS